MAKRRGSRANASAGRDVTNIATPISTYRVPPLSVPVIHVEARLEPRRVTLVRPYVDGRDHHPQGRARPVGAPSRYYRQLIVDPYQWHRLAFRYADKVDPCRRRNVRRRVLHALGIAGRKGVGAGKPRRTNEWSNISCR